MKNTLEPGTAMSSTGESERNVRELLNLIRDHRLAEGNFLGMLHILIGREIQLSDNTIVSRGLSWRELAALLKKVRWDKDAVQELEIDTSSFAPRDRQRFWYQVICQAGVDSEEAVAAGDRLAERLEEKGYVVGPAP